MEAAPKTGSVSSLGTDERMDGNRSCYEKNRDALNAYRFWTHAPLPAYDALDPLAEPIGNHRYTIRDRKSGKRGKTFCIARTERIEHPFFQNLEQPLLVQNEFNTYHMEYLYDNVRASEDWGGDNHIYMHYDSLDMFLVFLQVEDITSYLPLEKIVFLFGKEELVSNYPMDFSPYGIDYSLMQPQPIRLDEIHRLFVNLKYFACVGNDFLYGIMDYHKNLLTMGQRGIPDFRACYELYLHGKTVQDFIADYRSSNMEPLVHRAFAFMLGDIDPILTSVDDRPDPDTEDFFLELRRLWPNPSAPNEVEWFKLLYLAYSNAIHREFRSRIAPGIMLNKHSNVPKIYKLTSGGGERSLNRSFVEKFKYRSMLLPYRYPIVAALSFQSHKKDRNPKDAITIPKLLDALKTRTSLIFCRKGDPRLKEVKIVRLEDLKLRSRATLASLCEHFDIEWDDMLLRVTYNGKDVVFDRTSGFDPAPVYKRFYEMCNPFDYYRIEYVMSKYWRHLGYEPLFYQGNGMYTKEETRMMFELPFQFEMRRRSLGVDIAHDATRQELHAAVDAYLSEGDAPLDKNGEKMVPIPWLAPRPEATGQDGLRI